MKTIRERFPSPETLLFIGLAVLVGLGSAAGIWLFKRLVEFIHWYAFEQAGTKLAVFGAWSVLLLPVAGGLAVGWIRQRFIGEERHHGVAGIMEAVALSGGRLRYRRIPAKSVAAAISIGSGASVGPEDPSVQIGSNIGSMLGQWFHLSDERMRSLVAAGAASGVAAAFNAPIAGVFFAIEIILGEIGGNALGMVLLAAVVSAVFTQAVSGPQPAFRVPEYALNSLWELPLYLGLGILAGPVSAAYIRLLYFAQDVFRSLKRIPRWLHPAIAGGIVGSVGIFFPQVFGVGYESIESILSGKSFGIVLLLGLMLLKLLLTPVSIGGGFLGGVFAPSLFIGAMLGGAFGELARQIFPGLGINPPAFALVGMAAVLAGTVHAPLTAILLVFEMTHDYRIVLPAMFSVVMGLLISQRLQSDSVYAHGLARKGIRLERGRDVEVLENITVGEIMQTDPFTLNSQDTLAFASEQFLQTRHHGAPVLGQQGELVGIFTLQDLDAHTPDTWSQRKVGETCTRQPVAAYPDETIGEVLRRMGQRDVGRLPVVKREDPTHLVGLLRRSDLVRAYDAALTRRAALRHRVQQVRLDALTPDQVNVTEVTIEDGAPCAGKLLKNVSWPRDCLIASLRRGPHTWIPHGNTQLRPGDLLVIVAEGEARQKVLEMCKCPQ